MNLLLNIVDFLLDLVTLGQYGLKRDDDEPEVGF